GQPQPLATGTLITFPADQATDPYPLWLSGTENPNPTPSLSYGTYLGGAISIESGSNSWLTVSSFELLDASGSVVPCYEMDSSNDPNKNYIAGNQAFLVPQALLKLGSSYTAVFSGTINGVAAQKTWTFNTPSAQITQVTPGPFTLHNGSSLTIHFKAPSGTTGYSYSYTRVVAQVSTTQDSITLTLSPNAVTSSGGMSITATDMYYPSVPPITIQVTLAP
ncbi:MAG: hypothetical protein HKM02_08225, partial [Pseudomonadales bacterium]|nr:hypothetical protein [Pseudomonadales bacterium]